MKNTHGIAPFAFVLLTAVTFAHGANLVAVADPMPTEVGEIATPNHDPHHVSSMGTVSAPVPAEIAAWDPVVLRAEPEPAALSAPAFVAADTVLYAKANARLRAAPTTAAGVVAKLAADAPLRAIARSTDGAWWQVSLAAPPDQPGRAGYVHRDAVTKYRVAKTKLPAATAPVAVASPQPVPARRSQGLLGYLGYVDETMSRLDGTMSRVAEMAGGGPAPKIVRAEH
jgi:hypothetical protein